MRRSIREVEQGDAALHLLPILNHLASLGAFVWNPQTKRITLRSKACITSDNFAWLSDLFANVVVLQACEAAGKDVFFSNMDVIQHGIAELTGNPVGKQIVAIVDKTPHPHSGWRQEPDEMLFAAEIISVAGCDNAKIIANDLMELPTIQDPPWVTASGNDHRFTAEFPFVVQDYSEEEWEEPVQPDHSLTLLSLGSSRRKKQPRRYNSLFLAEIASHPSLGDGLLLRLRLPLVFASEKAVELANTWNLVESGGSWLPHFLGAWTVESDRTAPQFVCFVPNAFYQKGILGNQLIYLAARSRWAASVCTVQPVLGFVRSLIDRKDPVG